MSLKQQGHCSFYVEAQLYSQEQSNFLVFVEALVIRHSLFLLDALHSLSRVHQSRLKSQSDDPCMNAIVERSSTSRRG